MCEKLQLCARIVSVCTRQKAASVHVNSKVYICRAKKKAAFNEVSQRSGDLMYMCTKNTRCVQLHVASRTQFQSRGIHTHAEGRHTAFSVNFIHAQSPKKFHCCTKLLHFKFRRITHTNTSAHMFCLALQTHVLLVGARCVYACLAVCLCKLGSIVLVYALCAAQMHITRINWLLVGFSAACPSNTALGTPNASTHVHTQTHTPHV